MQGSPSTVTGPSADEAAGSGTGAGSAFAPDRTAAHSFQLPEAVLQLLLFAIMTQSEMTSPR